MSKDPEKQVSLGTQQGGGVCGGNILLRKVTNLFIMFLFVLPYRALAHNSKHLFIVYTDSSNGIHANPSQIYQDLKMGVGLECTVL